MDSDEEMYEFEYSSEEEEQPDETVDVLNKYYESKGNLQIYIHTALFYTCNCLYPVVAGVE